MVQNTLDGTLISPFSNITRARFGAWDIDIDLETEGIQQFDDFPNTIIDFTITGSNDILDILYSIRFELGVQTREANNNGLFTSNPALFKMDGKYNSDTKRFTFKAQPDAIIPQGSTFWIDVNTGGLFMGLPEFPTRANTVNTDAFGTQHPFQFTGQGAVNGARKNIHLLSGPQRITIKTPYFEQGLSTSELLQDGVFKVVAVGNSPVLGFRVFKDLRCSQPFQMPAVFRLDLGNGKFIPDNNPSTFNTNWALPTQEFLDDNPDCDFVGDIFPPVALDDGDAVITPANTISGSPSPGSIHVTYGATPAVLTDHRIVWLSQGVGDDGEGSAECRTFGGGPPDGDIIDFNKFRYGGSQSLIIQAFFQWDEV